MASAGVLAIVAGSSVVGLAALLLTALQRRLRIQGRLFEEDDDGSYDAYAEYIEERYLRRLFADHRAAFGGAA